MRALGSAKGQYTLEWAVLMAAMVTAVFVMRDYIGGTMRANQESLEMQLNGAMADNRP